jgi:trigger factor
MNITVEDLAPCRKRLRIEVPADRVTEEFDKVTVEFTKFARIPGFRPGKAPRTVVLKKFQKDIESELQRALVPKAYREACEKRNIRAVTSPNIEDFSYQHGLSMCFSTVVETAPEFTLPNYKGLALTGTTTEASEEEVSKTAENFLLQHAKFNEVTDRALNEGDIAVVKFNGTVDQKPILEVAPEAQQLASAETQWLLIEPNSFIPGFAPQLIGMAIGETRTIAVTFSADLYIEALKGQTASYEVELKGIKTRELPEITDELSQQLLQVPAAEFHTRIKSEIEERKKSQNRATLKRQIADQLEAAIQFELPDSMVQAETQDLIHEIVSENQSRGIPVNVLEEKKQEIFNNAARSAKEIVKVNFLLRKIAEVEKIAVTRDEIGNYVSFLAIQSGRPIEKLVKELSETGGLRQIEQRLLTQNVMDFLLDQSNVTIA